MDIGHFAPVVVVDVVLGLFGRGVVHISAKVERQRGERRVKRFARCAYSGLTHPWPWIRF
jgi:hypothetical protein